MTNDYGMPYHRRGPGGWGCPRAYTWPYGYPLYYPRGYPPCPTYQAFGFGMSPNDPCGYYGYEGYDGYGRRNVFPWAPLEGAMGDPPGGAG